MWHYLMLNLRLYPYYLVSRELVGLAVTLKIFFCYLVVLCKERKKYSRPLLARCTESEFWHHWLWVVLVYTFFWFLSISSGITGNHCKWTSSPDISGAWGHDGSQDCQDLLLHPKRRCFTECMVHQHFLFCFTPDQWCFNNL